jgi:hypothetical protein
MPTEPDTAGDAEPVEEPPAPAVADPYPEPANRDLLATIETSGPETATPVEVPSSQPGDKLTEKIRGTETLSELEAMQRDLSRR